MNTALLVGLVTGIVAASVGMAALAIAIPAIWRAYERRSDQYVERAVKAGHLEIQLEQARIDAQAQRELVRNRDAEITALDAQLKEEKHRAIKSSTDADLLVRGNRRLSEDGGRGEAGVGPGAGAGRTVPP